MKTLMITLLAIISISVYAQTPTQNSRVVDIDTKLQLTKGTSYVDSKGLINTIVTSSLQIDGNNKKESVAYVTEIKTGEKIKKSVQLFTPANIISTVLDEEVDDELGSWTITFSEKCVSNSIEILGEKMKKFNSDTLKIWFLKGSPTKIKNLLRGLHYAYIPSLSGEYYK